MKTKDELAQELELLKNRYGKVRTLEVPLDEEEGGEFATLFLKKLDRQTYSALMGLYRNSADPFRAYEFVLKALYIGGDDLIVVIDNDDAMLSLGGILAELLPQKIASLKKN